MKSNKYLLYIPCICCGLTIGMGVISLLGWLSGLRILASINSHSIPMAPNTAVAFIVMGIPAIVLQRLPLHHISRWISALLSLCVVTLGILTLIHYFKLIVLDINQVLLRYPGEQLGNVPVGYMSPLTAGNFILAGASLFLLTLPSSGKPIRNIASCLATTVTMVGSLVMLGYLYGSPILYGGSTVPMAINTACAFVLTGIGLIQLAGLECIPAHYFAGASVRARLMRVFFPIIMLTTLITHSVHTIALTKGSFNPAMVIGVNAVLSAGFIGFIVFLISKMVGGSIDRAEAMRALAEEDIREKNSIIQLIHEITIAANEALTVDDAILICLEKICQYAGWPVGHVYLPVENHNGSLLLKPSHLWYFKEPEKFVNLKKVTDIANFKPGEGLPGRVYETRRPAWIPDVTTDSDFPRVQYARDKNLDIGIRGALAFPIMEGNKVVSVLEFFSEKIEKTRKIVIEVVADLAIQIGRVTERKRAEESFRKLSQAVEQSTISVLITDTEGIIEYVNPQFIQMTGYDREELIGQNPRILKSGQTPSVEYQRLWENIVSGKDWQGEFQNKKKNGEMYWEHASISPIRNDKGEITHFLGVKEDITVQKKVEIKLLYMADHDPLTNLLNRRRFGEELEYWTTLSLRHNNSGALLFLDIDDFKHINDTLGHQVGDELLVCIADMLRDRLRETDILARLGGDEFAVILPHTNTEQVLMLSKQLGELIRNHTFVTKNGRHINICVSIGMVLFPEHGSDADTLLAYSDLALYKAKEEGKNRECLFSSDDKAHLDLQLDWKRRIQDVLKYDRFLLYLQPIMEIGTNTIVGYEALLRMVDEDGKIVAPAAFLSISERFGLIREIDRWVALCAIQIIKEKQLDRKGKFLEVNLSGKAFTNTGLLQDIKEAFNITGINPGNLIFEITETAIIENVTKAQHFINSLKEMGCRFALDDFGNGFSSFNYLKHLPVDTLKIDGSFIQNLPQSTVDQHLVKAMVEVARGLGKQTVAEYVESNETLQLLREYGIDYAQGYYIGRPGEITEILGY